MPSTALSGSAEERSVRALRALEPPRSPASRTQGRPRAARSGRNLVSSDRHGGADRHQPAQLEDVLVTKPDAAMRDPAGKKLRRVRPVDPDESPARPIREDARASACAEGEWPVERAPVSRQHVPDVELPLRRRPLSPANADGNTENRSLLTQQRRSEPFEVDDEMRVYDPVDAECLTRHPTGTPVRENRQSHAHP